MALLTNLGLAEFKKAVGMTNADILRNPKTGKLFLAGSNGKNYKVQGDINFSEDMVFLVEDDKYDEACLINKGRGVEVLASI